ncbi:MAG: DUF3107 domain-containing protein [Acidimicrobiales bacterium]|nr:DUF3107 domain-containing protein [Acidimicrobiales bacterium]
MDVRIGVTHSPKEIALELPEDTDREQLRNHIAGALGDDDAVLWLTDRRGRQVGVPSSKVAYVEIGSPEDDRRIGFGAP